MEIRPVSILLMVRSMLNREKAALKGDLDMAKTPVAIRGPDMPEDVEADRNAAIAAINMRMQEIGRLISKIRAVNAVLRQGESGEKPAGQDMAGSEDGAATSGERVDSTVGGAYGRGTIQNIDIIREKGPIVGKQIWDQAGKLNVIVPFEFFSEGDIRKLQTKYGSRLNFDRVGGMTGTMDNFIENILGDPAKSKQGKIRPGEAKQTAVIVPRTNDLTPAHLARLQDAGLKYVVMSLADINIANNRELMGDDEKRLRFQEHVLDVAIFFRYLDKETLADSLVYNTAIAYIKAYFKFPADDITPETFIKAIEDGDASQLIGWLLSYEKFQRYDAIPEHRTLTAPMIFA